MLAAKKRMVYFSAVIAVLICLDIYWGGKQKNEVPEDEFNLQYNYLDIKKPFFTRQIKNGAVWCTPARDRSIAQPFALKKQKISRRIFVIGGSAGMLFDSYDFKGQLQGIDAQHSYEIINCAMAGYDSSREILVLKDIIKYEPDLVLLFSGNNEFYHNLSSPACFNLGRVLGNSFAYRQLKTILARPAATRDAINRNFRNNVSNMIKLCNRNKVPLIICTLPVNLKAPPFGGQSAGIHFIRARLLMESKRWDEAIAEFREYMKKRERPLAFYLTAVCQEALGRMAQAKEYYRKSSESDLSAVKIAPSQNVILRRLGQAKQGVYVADIEKVFYESAQNGITSHREFRDHCHWLRAYNPLVAGEIAKTMMQAGLLPPVLLAAPSLQELADNAVQEWKTEYLLHKKEVDFAKDSIIVYGISEAAVNNLQPIYETNRAYLDSLPEKKDEIKALMHKNPWCRFISPYLDNAWPKLLCNLGELYRRNGEIRQGVYLFDKAIALAPAEEYPYIGKALCFFSQADMKNTIGILQAGLANCRDKKALTAYLDACSSWRALTPRIGAAKALRQAAIGGGQ